VTSYKKEPTSKGSIVNELSGNIKLDVDGKEKAKQALAAITYYL